jgi:hypothetical protein
MPKKNITEQWLKNLKFEKYLATDDAFKHLTAAQKANTKQVDVFDDPAKGGAVYRPLRDVDAQILGAPAREEKDDILSSFVTDRTLPLV